MKIADRAFESIAQYKYLATTITHPDLIHEEVKSRLNSDNA
jgi:hypothetical protein